jgi:hypothetical protein
MGALREMLAGSAAFRQMVQASSPDHALASIHYLTAPRGLIDFALIDFGDFGRERVAVTNNRKFQTRPGSELLLYIRQAALPESEEQDAAMHFMNRIGGIWQDLENLAGIYADESYAATVIEFVNPPQRITIENRQRAGDYFETTLSLQMSRQP